MRIVPGSRRAALGALVAAAFGPAAGAEEFDSAGVRIHYEVTGEGDSPVLLIHGLHSTAAMNWELPGITGELAKEYRVIALDNRGHGSSGRPLGEDAYGAEMAEDTVRLLDHLGIEKAHVIGYSMGGMITMKLLTTHPDRIRSAVLGGMGMLRQGSLLERFWDRIPARSGPGGLGAPDVLVKSLARLAVTEEQVRAIEVPVTVVIGSRDPVRQLYVAPLAQVRPDWPVVVIEGAGHIDCVAKPEFLEALQAALAKSRDRK